jgi:hypothetical protein
MQIDMGINSDIKFFMRAPKAFFASEHLLGRPMGLIPIDPMKSFKSTSCAYSCKAPVVFSPMRISPIEEGRYEKLFGPRDGPSAAPFPGAILPAGSAGAERGASP